MRIVASEEARELIAKHGGRLYVSVRHQPCCRSVPILTAVTDTRDEASWDLVDGDAGFDLFLPHDLARLPDELHLEAARFPRRVEAYWNGCAWIV